MSPPVDNPKWRVFLFTETARAREAFEFGVSGKCPREATGPEAWVRIPTQTGHQSDLKSDSVPIQSGQCSD